MVAILWHFCLDHVLASALPSLPLRRHRGLSLAEQLLVPLLWSRRFLRTLDPSAVLQ
jgi:hypothetical protein